MEAKIIFFAYIESNIYPSGYKFNCLLLIIKLWVEPLRKTFPY
jgi:hypothetical protein